MAKKRPFKRTDRLNRQIQQVLAVACLRETREPVLGRATITEVAVTKDLSLARVYFYATGDDTLAELKPAFERAKGFLRKRVGEEIRARQTPELRFIFDESVDRGRRIDEILHDIAATREEEPSADDDATAADDDATAAGRD